MKKLCNNKQINGKKCKYYFAFVIVILAYSCKYKHLNEIDVSGVKSELKIKRFEQNLFSTTKSQIGEGIKKWREDLPGFFDLYCSRILHLRNNNDSILSNDLADFVNNAEIHKVFDETTKMYPAPSVFDAPLNEAMKHYKYYFPENYAPTIVTFISGFNYSIVCSDSVLGIGLDMYLGENNPFYHQLGFPLFKNRQMRAEYIPTDALKGWAQTEFEPKQNAKNFLDEIVFRGKILYFLDLMFPTSPDSLKIGYSKSQLDFCQKNEGNIWSFFIEKNMLFSSTYQEYQKYITEGPTTNGFPKESPGMIGSWVGWQMVRKFMNENKNYSISKLMEEHDAQKILTLSKYKPGK